MRALNKGWIGIALVILFAASLFFFRGSARYSNLFNSDNFVANVSGTQISTTQFSRALEMNIGQFAQMIGEQLSGDQIRAFQIHQLVLQNLINNAIFENEFDNLDFILDDSTIAAETKKRFPNLYLNNKIDDDALNSFLRQQRLKIEDLVNIINYETRAVVFDNLLFEKIYPIKLSKNISLFDNQTREIDLLEINYNNISIPNFNKDSISKNNQELLDFFEMNADKYMSEEKRDLSYLVLDKISYTKKFTPTENEINDYYNNNKDLFAVPEKRSFKQFNFKSKDEAENFKIKITGLSKNAILDYANQNEIKFNSFEEVNDNQVLEELSNVIFSIKVNEISEVISTTLAHHIIILDKITKQKNLTINEAYEEIKDSLTNVQVNNFYNDLKLKISQQILDGDSIQEIATTNQLSIKYFSQIANNTKEVNDLNSAIINSAFTQNKEFISDIIDFNQNSSFIIYVDEIYPSIVEDIETVFNDVLTDYIKDKKINYANEIFENNSGDLTSINSSFNQKIQKKIIEINSKDLPNTLIEKIFDTKLNTIIFSSDEKNIYFAEIQNINIPETIDITKKIDLMSEFKNAFGNEIIKTKKISINDELINGLLSQYK